MRARDRIVFAQGIAAGLVILVASATAAPLGAVEPSKQEQHGIYVLNRARNNPTKYGNQIGVDLSGLTPRPPLAVNLNLTGSARFHAEEMLEFDYFEHVSEVTGDGPDTMAVQNGYDLRGGGLGANYGPQNTIESIAFGVNSFPTYASALALLIEDKGVPGLGHRVHLMAMNAFWAAHREIGMGRAAGTDPATGRPARYYAIHTAQVDSASRFLTGVVYADANRNGKYDTGEGVSGATIVAGASRTTSMNAGGYSIEVQAGTFAMTCSGGSFAGEGSASVTVTDANVEVDFRSGVRGAQVDFVDFVPSPFPGPDVSVGGTPLRGIAPFDVDFVATSDDATATYAWEFGDGELGAGRTPAHLYTRPGIYTAIASATNDSGSNRSLAVVAVGDATAPGTAPPSLDLTVAKLVVKASFKKPGKDKIIAVFSMEMPAGFLPGERTVSVNVGGVSADIPITAKNKGVDASGNKLVLKAAKRALKKAAKAGTPISAGVIAKVKLILQGDLADMLGVAGLRDATEIRTLDGFPIAILIDGHAYRVGVSLLAKSKEGKKSTGKFAP